jgi:hypothetical protein
MLSEPLASESPRVPAQELAFRLRRLAQDAYRVVNDRHASPAEAEELSRRIEDLREHTRGAHMFEIDRWLERALEVVIQHEQA